LFLVGQLWSSSINYYNWMMDSEQEIIELSTSEDTESEEENEKKEKEDKNNLITLEFNVIDMLLLINLNNNKKFISLHHPDITTPPPEIIPSIV
jgi:hypothetical protein